MLTIIAVKLTVLLIIVGISAIVRACRATAQPVETEDLRRNAR